VADSHEDQARTKDPAGLMTSPSPVASAPGAEATLQPDSAEAIPGFRDSLQRALKLFVRKHKGAYMLDFDWTLSRLERNIERPATLLDAIAVRMVCDAAYGSHRAWKELLDRLEGTVQQNVRLEADNVTHVQVEYQTVALPAVVAEANGDDADPN
jgi:hypothetical protein